MLRAASLNKLLQAILTLTVGGCGDIDLQNPNILVSPIGEWSGNAGDVLVELEVTAEGDCCPRFFSGIGRLITGGTDTLAMDFVGQQTPDEVSFNMGVGVGATLLGRFVGDFASSTSLVGTVQGPEAFGEPPAGPFGPEPVPLELIRQ